MEKYLHETIESTLSQDITYNEYEIILVNDGSTDGSLYICESYANIHSNIVVIDQKNQGVSASRNAGIRNAIGKYILFLDGDDLLETNILLKLKEIIASSKSDIFLCNYRRIVNNNLSYLVELEYIYPENLIKKFNINEFLSWAYRGDITYSWYVWRNIYRREYIIDNNLFFPSHIGRGEDFDWLFSSWMLTVNIEVINTSITIYRERITSSEMKKHTSLKQYLDSCYIVHKWYNIINSNKYGNLFPETIIILKRLLANYFISVSAHIYSMKKKDQKKAIISFNKLKFVCKNTNRKYYKCLNTLLVIDSLYLSFLNFIYVHSRKHITKKKIKALKN